MSYTSGVFYLDLVGGSDTARTALTSVTVANNGSGLVRCTKAAHGLVTGAVVDVTLNYAGAWKVTVITSSAFDLVGSAYSTSTAVTVTPRGGSSKADAWLTFTSGATSARIAPGDTIRVMASPDETLVGNATWTQYSKTITLAGAVTANISDCETAWTGSVNVTTTADATTYKENTKSAKHVIASAFTTGLVAFFGTGTIDFSGYQQVSFWVYNTAVLAASTLSLRLCSDPVGAVTVNTIAIPAIASSGSWVAITVDTGGALGSSIGSVALYADLDPGTQTIQLDNIIACKASSSADSLTLTSLIGKAWNRCWAASTTYATGAICKPSQGARNGFRYKVTAGGGGSSDGSEPVWPAGVGLTVVDGALTWTCDTVEETWAPIQSINGTTVKIDNDCTVLGNAGRGYEGATETVATYKREPIKLAMVGTGSNFTGYLQPTKSGNGSGFPNNQIVFIGGYDRTNMSTLSGETWISGQNGWGYGIGTYSTGADYVTLSNLNATRCYYGVVTYSTDFLTLQNCQFSGMQGYGWYMAAALNQCTVTGFVCCYNGAFGVNNAEKVSGVMRRVRISSNMSSGVSQNQSYPWLCRMFDFVVTNNGSYAANIGAINPQEWINWVTANNDQGAAAINLPAGATPLYMTNCSIGEASKFLLTNLTGQYIYSHKDGQVADTHVITTDGGTITSATDQRHTASGLSWKFSPTSTNRGYAYPLTLSVAKIACAANTAVNLTIWVRRDNTNIQGNLRVLGGTVVGVPSDVIVNCAPSINTWTQSGTLTFTPTENGVVEVFFDCWDGTNTTNSLWVDDFSIT